MALDRRQAFKFGFLARCADEGLSSEETAARIQFGLEKRADGLLGTILHKLFVDAPMLGLASAGLGGVGAGWTAAKLTEPSIDPEDIKRQELIAAYKLQADRARRAAARYGFRQAVRAPRPPQLVP